MSVRPVAIGLLVCEQVIVEEKTRYVTPVNCFTHKTVEQFPSEKVPFVVFALLTDGSGEMPLEVRVSRLDTMDVIFKGVVPVKFADQLHESRCIIRVRCSFPKSGQYEVMLLAANELVAHKKILITQKETST